MKYVTMFVALLALALPATAQTHTPPPAASYLSPTELVDKTPGDGVIRFTKKRGGIAKGRDAKLCPDYRPRFLYVEADESCPALAADPPVVAPPVVTTPPAGSKVRAALSAEGESFVQTDLLAVGFSKSGSVGTTKNAPGGFRTDTKNGLFRLCMYGTKGDDAICQGRAIGGFTVTINGKAQSNILLSGYTQIAGGFLTPLHWRGSALGIEVDMPMTLIGSELSHVVTLTNRTAATALVAFHWSADPDQAGAFVTTNRVVGPGSVEATLPGVGGVYYLASDDPRAFIGVSTYDKPTTIGGALPVGTVRKDDDVVQLGFPAVPIAAGQSVLLRFRQGLRQ